MTETSTRLRGRCHKFGHEMHMDTKVMPYKYIHLHGFDAEKLACIASMFRIAGNSRVVRVCSGMFIGSLVLGRVHRCH